MAFPISYSAATQNLTSGNLSGVATLAYTTPLGQYAWFLAIFATMIVVYIKTQSVGLTVFIGLLFFTVAQTMVGITGDSVFYTMIVIGVAILLFQVWWKG